MLSPLLFWTVKGSEPVPFALVPPNVPLVVVAQPCAAAIVSTSPGMIWLAN